VLHLAVSTITAIIMIITTAPEGVVSCAYSRPAGNRNDLVILEILPPHDYEGATVICNCHGQEYLTRLDVGSPVLVKNRLRESEKNPGDFLGDACPAFMQPTSSIYVENAPTTILPSFKDVAEDPGVTREFTIELTNSEHIEFFRAYGKTCKRGYKEAGRKLLGFAIDQIKEAKQFDLAGLD
jgi:hypothetical protein